MARVALVFGLSRRVSRFHLSRLASVSCWIFRLVFEAHRVRNECIFGESERIRLVQDSCIQKAKVFLTSAFWMQEHQEGSCQSRWTDE
jgi:hypothetical protein